MIDTGRIVQLSVSQVESFDSTQYGGCPRRWWFSQQIKAEQTKRQAEGEAGHALLATWFSRGAMPARRTLMGKAVTAAILKGDMPRPGADLLVEERFDGQPKTNARGEWNRLDVANTIHIGGVPFDGFIDLAFRRDDAPEVWDHKFVSEMGNARLSGDLIHTVQMPVYVASQRPYWPDAKHWRIVHHYVAKTGCESKVVFATVSTDEVEEQIARVADVVAAMRDIAPATSQSDVPYNLRSCAAWTGCPHQSNCQAFRGKETVSLTPEEEAMFPPLDPEDVPGVPVPAAVPQAPPQVSVSVPVTGPATLQPPAVPCVCGAALNADNASRLQSGEWKHIGCPATAAQTPAPVARQRRLKVKDLSAPEPANPIAPVGAAAVVNVPATGPAPSEAKPTTLPVPPAIETRRIDAKPALDTAGRAVIAADILDNVAALCKSLANSVRNA